jgi:hypothetical protein
MRKQRGVTMIGWIFLLIPLGIVLYAGIRLTPEYLNYYKVVTAMKETANQMKGDDTISPAAVRSALQRRFETGYIETPSVNDMPVTKGENGWEIAADYERVVPLFANLHLLVTFKTSVPIN